MIKSIGYDSKNRVLEIEFNSETVYQYFDVSQKEYKELINSSSHGQYFLQNTKRDLPS